uniref:Thioredoxin domain-containing protein n=1 Tax=Setaria italica TaxID=4555 RepID=K4AIP4_SETIT
MWNHNGIKGKQFLPTEKVASSSWQITRAAPKDPKKWWEKDMESNMKNTKSQEDFDKQLLMAGDKFTVVHFFSPGCGACKALHSKFHKFKDALKRHGVQTKSLAAEKVSEESEHNSIAPLTDIPKASDASPNMDGDDSPIESKQ